MLKALQYSVDRYDNKHNDSSSKDTKIINYYFIKKTDKLITTEIKKAYNEYQNILLKKYYDNSSNIRIFRKEENIEKIK